MKYEMDITDAAEISRDTDELVNSARQTVLNSFKDVTTGAFTMDDTELSDWTAYAMDAARTVYEETLRHIQTTERKIANK